jgi:hypothetical protein
MHIFGSARSALLHPFVGGSSELRAFHEQRVNFLVIDTKNAQRLLQIDLTKTAPLVSVKIMRPHIHLTEFQHTSG